MKKTNSVMKALAAAQCRPAESRVQETSFREILAISDNVGGLLTILIDDFQKCPMLHLEEPLVLDFLLGIEITEENADKFFDLLKKMLLFDFYDARLLELILRVAVFFLDVQNNLGRQFQLFMVLKQCSTFDSPEIAHFFKSEAFGRAVDLVFANFLMNARQTFDTFEVMLGLFANVAHQHSLVFSIPKEILLTFIAHVADPKSPLLPRYMRNALLLSQYMNNSLFVIEPQASDAVGLFVTSMFAQPICVQMRHLVAELEGNAQFFQSMNVQLSFLLRLESESRTCGRYSTIIKNIIEHVLDQYEEIDVQVWKLGTNVKNRELALWLRGCLSEIFESCSECWFHNFYQDSEWWASFISLDEFN